MTPISDTRTINKYKYLESKHILLTAFESNNKKVLLDGISRPPLWSSGQSFWLQIQRSRVRIPALPDFLSDSGSGTGCTQPREPREVN